MHDHRNGLYRVVVWRSCRIHTSHAHAQTYAAPACYALPQVWDMSKIGNQADRTSLLEVPKVEISSKVILGAAAALAFICALL